MVGQLNSFYSYRFGELNEKGEPTFLGYMPRMKKEMSSSHLKKKPWRVRLSIVVGGNLCFPEV